MTIRELIELLRKVDDAADENVEVCTRDVEINDYMPVTGAVYAHDEECVLLQTDVES